MHIIRFRRQSCKNDVAYGQMRPRCRRLGLYYFFTVVGLTTQTRCVQAVRVYFVFNGTFFFSFKQSSDPRIVLILRTLTARENFI